jgi:hypothetical protein
MTIVPVKRNFVVLRLATLLFGLLAAYRTATFGQKEPERFWLAGRYDGNRVVVYFDAVKFEGTMSSNARKIANPVAGAFFNPVELPAGYIARFQKTPSAEQFASVTGTTCCWAMARLPRLSSLPWSAAKPMRGLATIRLSEP